MDVKPGNVPGSQNWVKGQLGAKNTKIDKHSFLRGAFNTYVIFDHYNSHHFTIQDVLKIHVAFDSQPKQELNVCPCKVKGHLSANFAKLKYVMLMLHFCQYSTNPTTQNYIKLHVNGLEANSSNA